MQRLSIVFVILSLLLLGCRRKESSILSDEIVSEKCRSIVENFECWFDGETMNWLKSTPWELVSARHKDLVIESMAKIKYPYGSDYSQVFTLGYMDASYAFARIAKLRRSSEALTRGHVAESIPLEGKYKEAGLRILVELLFDSDKNVRQGVASTISRRLDAVDSLPLLLLYYFEHVYQKPVTLREAISDPTTDWARALADSKYRGVLVPWLEEVKKTREFPRMYPVKQWINGDPPSKWACWWQAACAEQDEALVEGKRVAQKMRRKYRQAVRRST